MKQKFARYISHELRTPLNTVSLGLVLLTKRAPAEDDMFRDNLKDIQSSVEIALGILNEMLTYDKLQSNILQLEKLFVPPVPFFLETIEPMVVQVSFSCFTIVYLLDTRITALLFLVLDRRCVAK